MYSFFFFFCLFFSSPLFWKVSQKSSRVKNTRAFFGEREIQSTQYRYKNEKVRAFEEDDDDEDDDDSRFFFFGFFSKRRAMMMNNKILVYLRSFRTIADEKTVYLSSRTLSFFSPLVFVRKNRASKKERGKEEEDARARARYGFFFGFSTSSDDGERILI